MQASQYYPPRVIVWNVAVASFLSIDVRQIDGVQPNAQTSQRSRQPMMANEKFVTILFADIVDLTRLIEKMEPDVGRWQVVRVLNCMRDARSSIRWHCK